MTPHTARQSLAASTMLAMRGVVQNRPYEGLRAKPIEAGEAAAVVELAKGFGVDKASLAQALRAQQLQAAQDMRDLGMFDAADRIESMVGVAKHSAPREH